MFSFKNGILNISLGRSWLDTLVDAGFFLLLCSLFASPSNVEGANYFYYFSFFLFFGATFIRLLLILRLRGSFTLPSFTFWYGGFLLLSLASTLWAEYPANSMLVISRMVQSTVITFCMSQNYATRSGVLKCVRMFAWAGAYATVFMAASTPFEDWFNGGFGFEATQLNPNAIGMIFTLCVLASFYFAFYCGEKKYYILAATQLLVVILTSSRKSLISSVAGIVLLIMMRSRRRNIIGRVLVVSGFVLAVYYLIMSVPELYSAIGIRIESMMNYVFSDGDDYSLSLRQLFIKYATDMFFEKPLLGYGINNFIVEIRQRIGIGTYAHNNYYEILADLGLVGFVMFYGYYIYLVSSLVRKWRRSEGSLVKLMIVWVAVIMVCEYGLVSYYTVYIQMTLCCAYLFICAYDRKDDYSNGVPSYMKYKYGIYS